MSDILRPHRQYFSSREELMQLTLERGTWIQVCCNIGTIGEPRYEIIEVVNGHDGKISLKSNMPAEPWPVDDSGAGA